MKNLKYINAKHTSNFCYFTLQSIVKELKRKANDAYSLHQSGQTGPRPAYSDEADELAIISGLSQVTSKTHITPPSSQQTSPIQGEFSLV